MRLKGVRAVIENGGPDDSHEARRLALRATGGIDDPARAAELHDMLMTALVGVDAAPAMGPDAIEDARAIAEAVLQKIEVASS